VARREEYGDDLLMGCSPQSGRMLGMAIRSGRPIRACNNSRTRPSSIYLADASLSGTSHSVYRASHRPRGSTSAEKAQIRTSLRARHKGMRQPWERGCAPSGANGAHGIAGGYITGGRAFWMKRQRT